MAKRLKTVWKDNSRHPSRAEKKEYGVKMSTCRWAREELSPRKAVLRKKKNKLAMRQRRKEEKEEKEKKAELAAKEQCNCGKMVSELLAREKKT